MSRMKDLFGDEPAAYARSSDPDTSHAAARSMESKISALESLVARTVIASGDRGMITQEVCDQLGLEHQTVSPRMRPLINKQFIRWKLDPETGKPLKRISRRSGRNQNIHVKR
jgi:hypothetical protein